MKRTAFTLAEVIITIGIIGIVAALTMPMLLAKYQKKQVVTQLKKTVAIIENAFMLSQAENGDMKSWHYPTDNSIEQLDNFLSEYFYPYIKIEKKCDSENNSPCVPNVYNLNGTAIQNAINNTWVSFVLPDGVAIAAKSNVGTEGQLSFRIDLNSSSKPNRSGRDVFCYDMKWYSNYDNQTYFKLLPCFGTTPRNDLVKTNGACAHDKTSHGLGCSALIRLDNWEISDDYPW